MKDSTHKQRKVQEEKKLSNSSHGLLAIKKNVKLERKIVYNTG